MRRNSPRKRKKRERRPIMIVVGERNYKTEEAYLKHFRNNRNYSYTLRLCKTGNYTDPNNIYKVLKTRFKEVIGDEAEDKDCAVALVDLDCNSEKAEQLHDLMKKEKRPDRFGIIVSNPCFEVWLIDHFTPYCPVCGSSQQVKDILKHKYLKDKVKDYQEGTDIFHLIADEIDTAIANEERNQRKYRNMPTWPDADHNPRTDMPRLIKKLTKDQ